MEHAVLRHLGSLNKFQPTILIYRGWNPDSLLVLTTKGFQPITLIK